MIVNGAGTYQATVLWGEPGTGSVTVTEETSAGCSWTTEAYEVVIETVKLQQKDQLIFDLSAYPSGLYFIRVIGAENHTATSRFIISR